jgi:hypothetical protein
MFTAIQPERQCKICLEAYHEFQVSPVGLVYWLKLDKL